MANTDDEGNSIGVEGVLVDISERIKSEQIKEEFISITNHEIKTPLTTMKAYIDAINKKVRKGQFNKIKPYIEKVNIYINKLNRLINDYMDIIKLEHGNVNYTWEFINFNELVSETVKDMQLINPDYEININGVISKEIMGDKNKLNQVLINLITNAVKYSRKIKKIDISLSEEEEKAVICVSDYGPGIPKKYWKKIFDKFFQVDKKNIINGFGLGLYICNEIIRQHNGKIWVDSKLNQGSNFYISLPIRN